MSEFWQPRTFREMFAPAKKHIVLICSLKYGTLANTRIEKTRSRKTFSTPSASKYL